MKFGVSDPGDVYLNFGSVHYPAAPENSKECRSAAEEINGKDGITYCAARRRRGVKRDYRMTIEVMQHIPAGMQQPAYTYEGITIQPAKRYASHTDAKDKLPHTQATAQVCGASAGYGQCTDATPMWVRDQ